jgi:hypothetical protein
MGIYTLLVNEPNPTTSKKMCCLNHGGGDQNAIPDVPFLTLSTNSISEMAYNDDVINN